MKFKIFGVKIYVSFLFAAVVAFMIATDRTGLILPTLFAVTIHEGGHLFAMWLVGCQPKSVRLLPATVQITRKMATKKGGELIVCAFGPACNLFMFGLLYLNYSLYKSNTSLYLALLNLIVCLYNLLPVKGLDGGTLLKAVLEQFLNERKTNIVLATVSLSLAGIITFFGVYLTLCGRLNLSVFIVAAYIVVVTVMKM